MNPIRLLMAIVAAALLVAMISWARGTTHHRGLDVGSLSGTTDVPAVVTHPPVRG